MMSSARSRSIGAGTPSGGPFVIGLTGGIASGKSTVAKMLRKLGAQVIDADTVYRSLLTPKSGLWQDIVNRFGSSILGPDGNVNRAALGNLVFRDPLALADLDRISHPAVVARIRRELAASTALVVAIEAVKLVQSGLLDDVDELWVITAEPEVRLQRLMAQRGLEREAALARMAAHPIPVPGGVNVNISIENSGDLEHTADQVEAAWRALANQTSKPGETTMVSASEEVT